MHKTLSPSQISTCNCPVCGSESRRQLFDVYDHEYRTVNRSFPLVKCNICDCVYLSPRPNLSALSVIYPPEYNNFHTAEQNTSYVRRVSNLIQTKRIAKLLRPLNLPPNFMVLDVGCGDGYCLDRIREAFPRAITHGVEPDQDAAKYVSRNHTVFCGVIEDYHPQQLFDLIISSHVVEHVEDPVAFLAKLGRLLRPGGAIIIDTPNIDCLQYALFQRDWGGVHAPRHWTLFSDKTLIKAAQQAGLRVDTLLQLPINTFWVWSIHSWLCTRGARRFADRYFNTIACVSARSFYYLVVMVAAECLERLTAFTPWGLGQIRAIMIHEHSSRN
jgi:SAM-dependent methyltransferase